jgi:3-oxoacyl-[acyl-carrier protein] reductase
MQHRRFGRIVNITSAMMTTPPPFMAASSGARTGLTAVMSASPKWSSATNVTINQLVPQRIDSGRELDMAHLEMRRHGVTFEDARTRRAASIAAQRPG